MTEPAADGAEPAEEFAVWPAGTQLSADDTSFGRCAACGLAWHVHRSMSGFRVRCRCGGWVTIPAADLRALPGATGGATGGALAVSHPAALAAPDEDEERFLAAQPRPRQLAGVKGWDGRPLRPEPDGSWSLRHAEVEARTRWTNRTVVALAAIMGCFLVPPLLVQLLTKGENQALYMPIVSIASSLLVLVVAHTGREFAVQGLRGAAVRHFVEAVLVALATAGVALLWVKVVKLAFPDARDEAHSWRTQLGLPMLLLVYSFCPGVFEELAFRGLLQGRLYLLMGRIQAILVVGAAFGLAHGVTIGLPFHIGIGIWLAFLRDRSGSLLPGMLAHALYNATIVIALSSTG